MKKWTTSMQERFENLPHNVRTWRDALDRASRTLDDVWKTAGGQNDLHGAGLLRGNRGRGLALPAPKGFT